MEGPVLSAAPASLVAAFTSSLASTVPLARAVWNIPAETRLHLTLPDARENGQHFDSGPGGVLPSALARNIHGF